MNEQLIKNKQYLEELTKGYLVWLFLYFLGFDYIDGEYYGSGARCIEQGDKPWTASDGKTSYVYYTSSFGTGCYQVINNLTRTIMLHILNMQLMTSVIIECIGVRILLDKLFA